MLMASNECLCVDENRVDKQFALIGMLRTNKILQKIMENQLVDAAVVEEAVDDDDDVVDVECAE